MNKTKKHISSLKKILLLLVMFSFVSTSLNAEPKELPYDLTEVNLGDLLNLELEVTSPSKKPQSFSSVPAALFVLTARDIKRSGVTHIADALRLVPGINVAQVNGNQWAITARGFNNTFARHLLVLLDGQTIFTPAFNGVFWDQYDIDLDNIERIEVIRGPGASVWGSNAVNGVINIITYKASHTQGSRVSVGGGTREKARVSVRHGGSIDQHTHYRAYSKFSKKGNNQYQSGEKANDDYDSIQTGFRLDKEVNKRDNFLFIANGSSTDKFLRDDAPSLTPPFVDSQTYSGDKQQYGASLISRYSRQYSEVESAYVQMDYNFERQLGQIFPLFRHTAHVEAQHRQRLNNFHDFIYGASYRFNYDDIGGNFADNFIPQQRNTNLFTFYVNDEMPLVDDKLMLTLGTKVEHNAHTQFEFMPNARLLWKVKPNTSVWTAVSRAVANPSRVFDNVAIPVAAFPEPTSGLTGLVTAFGNPKVEAENLMAYEAGFRTQIGSNSSLDVTAFYNNYDDFQTLEAGAPYVGFLKNQTAPALIIPYYFGNGFEISTYGAEAAVSYIPFQWWQFHASYAYLQIEVDKGNSTDDLNPSFYSGASPHHQANLRSQFDLNSFTQFDTTFRYVDRLPADKINSYLEMDIHLAFALSENNELSINGFNLLENGHEEFASHVIPAPLVRFERTYYIQFTHNFS